MSRRIAALSITAIALFGLTACTGSPATTETTASTPNSAPSASQAPEETETETETETTGQTKEEACTLLQDNMEGAADGLQDASSATDPAAAIAAMQAVSDTLAETASQITNEEVAAVLPGLQQTFADASELIEAVVNGDTSRVEELSSLDADFAEASAAFEAVCAP